MRDSTKIILLLILCLTFSGYFLLKGINADNYGYFLSTRTPKILAMVIASIAIACSSLIFQTITQNVILTPSILGFDTLYVMIQSFLLFSFGSASMLLTNQLFNFGLSSSLMLIVSVGFFVFYFRKENVNLYALLLIGLVCSSLFSSVTNFFTLVVDPTEFATVQRAMFASFNNVNEQLVYWAFVPLIPVLFYLYRRSNELDVFWLGIDNAKSLGIDTRKTILQMMVMISLLISIATALIGPVLFLGLIVASLTRQLFKTYHHPVLMLASSLLSLAMLVSGQWLVEQVFHFETTLSVVLNFVGGSYFLWLLIRRKVH